MSIDRLSGTMVKGFGQRGAAMMSLRRQVAALVVFVVSPVLAGATAQVPSAAGSPFVPSEATPAGVGRSAVLRSDVPVQAWVTDGSVYAIAATPAGVYVGGSFTLVGRPTGSWVALGAGGSVVRRPLMVNEQVVAAVSDGKRGWFLVAEADEGETSLFHLRVDGTLDAKWHPTTDGPVAAIARSGRKVFLAGEFLKVGGRSHARLAANRCADGARARLDATCRGEEAEGLRGRRCAQAEP